MPYLQIRIQSLGDSHKPLFPEHASAKEVELFAAGILQGGMESGKTSVGFYFRSSNGDLYFAQTSADIIRSFAAALQGAEERFKLGLQ